MAREKPIALVTGASSGLGQETALALARAGYQVFGTSRQPHPHPSEAVEMVALDVRDDRSVAACIETVLAGARRIDLLVNNAGILIVAPAEETSDEAARNLFETNFWGVVRITNAVLPSMRAQRSGRIVNISSLAGLMAGPGEAFYCASKYALEAYTEALFYELAPFGIHVSLVEPGFFRSALFPEATEGTIPDYDALRRQSQRFMRRSIEAGSDPAVVGRQIARIAQQRAPRLRYPVGLDAILFPRVAALLPDRLLRWGVRWVMGLPAWPRR
ncbi:MAG: SDR family NAD(P)-dependent oxidoreductase [Candidatus Promineifilaceae bacterium]|nr:SDR family NAD(P)-dependent oxidoreductase [Candidatus Promineifilaceae bacterium]